jgi:hypothetical protein
MPSLVCPAVWVTFLFLRFEFLDPRFEDGLHGQLLQIVESCLAKLLKSFIVTDFELNCVSNLMFFARVGVRHLFAFGWRDGCAG